MTEAQQRVRAAATLSGFGGGTSWKEFESTSWKEFESALLPALATKVVVVLQSSSMST
jgi:hypothetical protein